jgi:hypothetical protein
LVPAAARLQQIRVLEEDQEQLHLLLDKLPVLVGVAVVYTKDLFLQTPAEEAGPQAVIQEHKAEHRAEDRGILEEADLQMADLLILVVEVVVPEMLVEMLIVPHLRLDVLEEVAEEFLLIYYKIQ